MKKPVGDQPGYPSAHNLRMIEKWDFNDVEGLLEFVKGNWWPGDGKGFVRRGRNIWLHTWGWSGNEEIMRALGKNLMFWTLCWQSSERGGHFRFELPEYLGKGENKS